MKKILSLILACMMVLSCAAFVAADEAEVVAETNAAEDYALEFLVNKNIWKGYSSEELVTGAADNVERWQMALLVSRISTGWLDDEKWEDDVANDSTFTDLEGTAAENYLGAISYANQNGIIEGYTAEKFGPTDFITYRDGLTMAVRTLGYKGLAYPWGYIEKAVELGLTEDIDKAYTADLTRGEVGLILYNALFATTKSGETLAKSMFDVDFGWENIVVVASDYGVFGNYTGLNAKCPDGYVAFKILADDNDATLSSATYYVKATELGLESTKYNEEQTLLGESYIALFEIADNGIVNMIEAHSLLSKTVWNYAGSKDVKFELMKYTLVEKYYDTPYISEAAGDELMLFAMNTKTSFIVDKTQVYIDVTTGHIYKGTKVEWWYDQVNNRYWRVVWNDNTGKVAVDFMDETIFEEWYAEAILKASGTTVRYNLVTKLVNGDTINVDTDAAYARLKLYDVDNDGNMDRALYKTYRMVQVINWDPCWWNESDFSMFFMELDYVEGTDDAFTIGSTGTMSSFDSAAGEGSEWVVEISGENVPFSNVSEFRSFIANDKVDDVTLLANFDKEARVLDVIKVFEKDSADKDNGIFDGLLRGYSITKDGASKINIDGRVLTLGYENLEGAAIRTLREHNDYGNYVLTNGARALAKVLNDYMWKRVEVTICDGKVVDIDQVKEDEYADSAIVVLGYAGITYEDNMIAVYGYSLDTIKDTLNAGKPVEVEIFKIKSINGWHKGDYKYYPVNAFGDESFQPGTIYEVNAYDAELDAYDVDAMTLEEYRGKCDLWALRVTFERGYRIWEGSYPEVSDGAIDDWDWIEGEDAAIDRMTSNDKYLFIYEDGTINVHTGIVDNDNWFIDKAGYYMIQPEFNQDGDAITDCLHVFLIADDASVHGFNAAAYETSIVLYDEDSYVLNAWYDEDITNDAFLGAGDFLNGSIQRTGVVVKDFMSGDEVTVAAANNINFKVGQYYKVVGNTIVAEFNEDLSVFDTWLETAKELYLDTSDDATRWTVDGRYVIMDTIPDEKGDPVPITMTYPTEGWDDPWWWTISDDVCIGALEANNAFMWKSDVIAGGILGCGGYAGGFQVNDDGIMVPFNFADEIEGGAWVGETHEVVIVWDTGNDKKFTVIDLGVVAVEEEPETETETETEAPHVAATFDLDIEDQTWKKNVETAFTATLTGNSDVGEIAYATVEYVTDSVEASSIYVKLGLNKWQYMSAADAFGESLTFELAESNTVNFKATFATAGEVAFTVTLFLEDGTEVASEDYYFVVAD